MVYQMDVKSAFLYGTIKEEVYVYQPPRLTEGKSAGTLIDTEKPLLKDPDDEDVDVHIYRSMIGSLMNLTSSRSDIMFAFWNTVAIKKSNDVTRLQALVDRKKVVITKTATRDALRLDDADGVDCLPNEEIFAELARMGYEKPSTKLTFYKAFFSSQLQALVDKKKVVVTEAAIRDTLRLDDAEGVDCLPNEEIFTELARMGYEKPSTKLTLYKAFFSSHLVRNVDNSSKFYMYPRFIHLIIQNQLGDLSTHTTKYISLALTQKVFTNMRRVGKGCSRVETPLFEGMLVAREPEEQGDAEEQGTDDNATEEPDTAVSEDDGADFPMSLLQEALDGCAALARRVEHLEHDKIAQDLEIIKPKTRVKKLERDNKVKALKLRRLRKVKTSQRVDTLDDTIMEDEEKKAEEVKDITGDAQAEGRQAEI
nr:hypothetical protein [Tanacetum cinerariifolium]